MNKRQAKRKKYERVRNIWRSNTPKELRRGQHTPHAAYRGSGTVLDAFLTPNVDEKTVQTEEEIVPPMQAPQDEDSQKVVPQGSSNAEPLKTD